MKTVIIPSDGESINVSIKGRSIYIVLAPPVTDFTDAPVISFQQAGTGDFPGQTGNKMPYTKGVESNGFFSQVVVTGTSESAGGELILLPLDFCVEPFINPDLSTTIKSSCGVDFEVSVIDAVKSLSDPELINAEGKLPVSITVQARSEPIAYAFDVNPDQGHFGKILQPPAIAAGGGRSGDLLEILGIDFIRKFRFISAQNLVEAFLQVTLRY